LCQHQHHPHPYLQYLQQAARQLQSSGRSPRARPQEARLSRPPTHRQPRTMPPLIVSAAPSRVLFQNHIFIRLSRVVFYCHFTSNNNTDETLTPSPPLQCSLPVPPCADRRPQNGGPARRRQPCNNDVNSSINNSLNKTESTIKGLFKRNPRPPKPTAQLRLCRIPGATAQPRPVRPLQGRHLKTYSNYDFVPANRSSSKMPLQTIRTANSRRTGG